MAHERSLHLTEQPGRAARGLRQPQQRLASAGGIGRRGAQQFAQLRRRAGIEPAPGPPVSRAISRNACSATSSWPSWNMNTGTLSRPSSPALAQSSSTFSSMASPTKTTARTPDATASRRASRQHLADLGVAAAAIDLAHQFRQLRAVGNPSGGAALVEAAIIDEPDIKAAECGRLAKHVGLQRAGHVPGRLPAHRGIEREHQPAPGAGAHAATSRGPWRRRRRCLPRSTALAAGSDPALPDFAPKTRRPRISVWWVRRT